MGLTCLGLWEEVREPGEHTHTRTSTQGTASNYTKDVPRLQEDRTSNLLAVSQTVLSTSVPTKANLHLCVFWQIIKTFAATLKFPTWRLPERLLWRQQTIHGATTSVGGTVQLRYQPPIQEGINRFVIFDPTESQHLGRYHCVWGGWGFVCHWWLHFWKVIQ